MLVPPRHLVYSWLPTSLRKIGTAAQDFKTHMVKMLDEENKLMNQGEKGTGSLMTSFIRALDTRTKDSGSSASQGLSVDEIFGNIFVINFAGHDTTANTLAFSMLLLAAYPEVQQWVAEEINDVISETASSDWDYVELFPHLLRCRAVLVSFIH
jgi:cytochrome P450